MCDSDSGRMALCVGVPGDLVAYPAQRLGLCPYAYKRYVRRGVWYYLDVCGGYSGARCLV